LLGSGVSTIAIREGDVIADGEMVDAGTQRRFGELTKSASTAT
jgi:hypothetical protein